MWKQAELEDIWGQVTSQPVGIRVRTEEPMTLMEALTDYRKKTANPELFLFSMVVRGRELWITRKQGLEVRTDGPYKPLEE